MFLYFRKKHFVTTLVCLGKLKFANVLKCIGINGTIKCKGMKTINIDIKINSNTYLKNRNIQYAIQIGKRIISNLVLLSW